MNSLEKRSSPRPWIVALLHCGAIFLLLSSSGGAETYPAITIDEQTQMDLGDHFSQEGDYYRAITEYKRFLFFFSKSRRAEEAFFKIAQSYFNGKKWDEAILACDQLLKRFPDTSFRDKALFLKGLSFREKKDYPQARFFFEGTKAAAGEAALRDEAQKQIALTYVREENWPEAARAFRQIDPDSPLYERGKYFAQGLDPIDKISQKSPEWAGFLAAVLPGSGHVYVERYRDGAIAFLLNGAFMWGMVESFQRKNYVVGGILTFFELGWYSGNIYSAVSGAHKYNRKQRKDYLDRLERQSQITVGITLRESRPMVFLEYRF